MSRAYSVLGGLLLILAFSDSQATKLGEINVLSAVGEPFSATIEVQLSGTDSLDQMIARIASADKHTAFGINYADYSSTITIAVVQRKEKILLILRSTKELREVYLEFIFQLRFVSGSIFRAYSVLPDFKIPQLGDTEKNTQQANQPRKEISAGAYTVQNLDSLWLIATAMDRKLGSVTQRIRLLKAANPTLENGEIHPGDRLFIPADNSPIRKTTPRQKPSPSNDSINTLDANPISQPISKAITKTVMPTFASEQELTAVARRAAGYRIVRLTALSGPQFRQSQSGVATLSKDSNDSMSLELVKIKENLEAISQEYAILTSDIRRLKMQKEQRDSEKKAPRDPSQVSQTNSEEQDTSLTQNRQRQVSGGQERNRESEGISSTVLFFLTIIFIGLVGLVGIILWRKRRKQDANLSVAESTRDLTALAARTAGEVIETAVTDNAPTQNIAAFGDSSDNPESFDEPTKPSNLIEQSPYPNSIRINTDPDKTAAKIEDPHRSGKPVSIFRSKDNIVFVSVGKPASQLEPISDKPESISVETRLNDPEAGSRAPPTFEDPRFTEEFLDELEHDEPENSDQDIKVERDSEIASAVLNEEEIKFEDEFTDEEDTKSMHHITKDIRRHDGAVHESITSIPLSSTDQPEKNDSVLIGQGASWANLQQEWDNALASGIDSGQSMAVAYIELDDMAKIEDQQGIMRTEDLITQAQRLIATNIQTHGKSLHRIKDHTFLFFYPYKTETELRELGKSLVRIIQDHEFVVRSEHLSLSLSVGIVPFTTLFNSLDDYLRCGKRTVVELRTDLDKARTRGGVAIHFEGRDDAEDWGNEEELLAKVNELLQTNMFEVEYQTLINLSDNHQQVYMCKTELSPEVDIQALPPNFLKKAFTCSATPVIERQSILTFMDKIRSLGDESIKMLFRIDIRSAMDPKFGPWLFEELELKGIDPSSITLFVYADDVITHKPHIMSFAATLRQQGSRLGMLNVDYDADHLQAALDVGASIVRINPSIVDDVVESSVRFGSRPVASGTRESSRFKDFLTSFQKRDIETVLFSTYVEAIPGLVVLNANNLRASYIQTPIGMISDDHF